MRSLLGLLLLLALSSTNARVLSPKADCTVSINDDLPTNQALVIKPGGTFDLNGFFLPQSGDVITFSQGEEVLLACPGNGNSLTPTGNQEELVTCVGGKQFATSGGSTYSFTSLGCRSNPFHTARKREGASCEIPGPYSLLEIGFELSNGDFYVLMEVCFNEATGDSLYSTNIQTPDIDGYQSGYPRPGFVQGDFYPEGLDVDYQYSRDGQRDAVAQAVGSTSLANQYIKSSGDYFLSRGHMTAKADFVYGVHQRATFWFLNVAPQWQTVNGGNWNNLEMSTRTFAAKNPNELRVYTGTHGVTTLADISGMQVPIYIAYDDNNNGLLRVPHFYWRVVYEPSSGKGVAFVGLNNPYEDNPGADFYLCEDVCDQVSWVNWKPTDQRLGYAYCCEVGALAAAVEEIPSLDVTGLLV